MTRASVWLIAGPTASGKSRLALALAERVGAEIVNADSMQVYREIAILTARPGPEDLARAPHHLYGVASAAEPWSVGRWLRAVEPVLQDIAARGRAAIVVGGTGLYFRALTQGLSDIPSPPTALREAVEAAYRSDGEASVRARLGALDAAAEARIAPGDRQRLVRALSVALATGRALSDWQAETATPPAPHWAGLVLDPPRAALYARCDARLGAMVEGGALEEVRRLIALGLGPGLPAAKALGAPEFAAHLRGEIDLETALSAARQATRRYAKRQTTWFRNQTSAWPRLTEWDLETAARALGVSL